MSDSGQLRRSPRAIAVCLIGLVALVVLDLGTKAWALDTLAVERTGEPPPLCQPNEAGYIAYQRMRAEAVVLIPGYLELRYAENCGAAFGLLRDAPSVMRQAVFGVAATVASAVLIWLFVVGRGGALFAWSVPFIVSGAVGNLVDRIRLGYVVDFIRFHIQDGWQWPTFNIADAAITVGVALLLLDGLLEGRREKARAAEPTGEPGENGEPAG